MVITDPAVYIAVETGARGPENVLQLQLLSFENLKAF